jgi:hypothetical protein
MRTERIGLALIFSAGTWLGGAWLVGCGVREATPAPDTVARIAQSEVRYSQFESYVERTVGDTGVALASDVLSKLFDQFLDEKLLVHLAQERGLVRATGSQGGHRRAIEALLLDGVRGEAAQAEVSAYYEEHREEFARPERVKLRQILAGDRATAERARQQIEAGADFAEVARKLSQDPAAAGGGYQGEVSRADLPPAFADVIFSLSPGEVSSVVPAEYGFHIFQAVSRAPAEQVPLAKAREEILGRLRRERADRLLGELVSQGREQYNVLVYERNLPFDYEGSYSHGHSSEAR